MSAVISPCGLYRYSLTRHVDIEGDPAEGDWGGRVLWVMLNPSTADATINDPTIKRCIAFTRAWKRGRMDVVNLYAYRATIPNTLWNVEDPVGPENDDHIGRLAEYAGLIVCAWGKPGPDPERALHVRGLLENRGTVYHLRLNKDGSPGHPLYLPGELRPQPWL